MEGQLLVRLHKEWQILGGFLREQNGRLSVVDYDKQGRYGGYFGVYEFVLVGQIHLSCISKLVQLVLTHQ